MAKSCAICGKQAVSGNRVSHSNRKTPRRWRPNLQAVKTKIGRQIKQVLICVRCLKTLKKKGQL